MNDSQDQICCTISPKKNMVTMWGPSPEHGRCWPLWVCHHPFLYFSPIQKRETQQWPEIPEVSSFFHFPLDNCHTTNTDNCHTTNNCNCFGVFVRVSTQHLRPIFCEVFEPPKGRNMKKLLKWLKGFLSHYWYYLGPNNLVKTVYISWRPLELEKKTKW